MVHPPVKTAATSSSDRSASVSRPTLHSTVARRVRCRSGRSTAPVPSASSEAASRSSSAGGSSSRVRAAASSMASGRPSRRRQISATAAALPSVRAKPGRTARARSTNSATAGEDSSSATEAAPEPARQRQDRVFPLGPQPEHRAAGGQDRQLRAAGQQLAQVGRDLDHLLQVVQDQQPGAVAERLGQRLCRRARPRQVGARRPADGGQDQPGIGDRVQRHEHGARAEPVPQPLAYRHRQPGLADPARPGQRHQPHPGLPEQIGHLADGPLPPEQQCRAHRQPRQARGRPAATAPRPGPGRQRQRTARSAAPPDHRVPAGPARRKCRNAGRTPTPPP